MLPLWYLLNYVTGIHCHYTTQSWYFTVTSLILTNPKWLHTGYADAGRGAEAVSLRAHWRFCLVKGMSTFNKTVRGETVPFYNAHWYSPFCWFTFQIASTSSTRSIRTTHTRARAHRCDRCTQKSTDLDSLTVINLHDVKIKTINPFSWGKEITSFFVETSADVHENLEEKTQRREE